MRIYDPRLGKFLSVDPLTKDYPMLSPYQFASNRPIDGIDLDGAEFLSFHSSMYRMEYNIMRTDIVNGDGTKHTVTTSNSVVNVIYSNIPTTLQDPENRSFKWVNGGPVTTKGRDYDPNIDGAMIYNVKKYHGFGNPAFNGLPPGTMEPSSSTKPVGRYYGDETPVGANGGLAFKVGTAAAAGQEMAGIAQNIANIKFWKGSTMEGKMREKFYLATNAVDYYNSNVKGWGAVLGDGSMRVDLINFITDGYLPTAHTDKYIGAEFSTLRKKAYEKQLLTAQYGIQIIRDLKAAGFGIELQQQTKDAIRDVLKKYLAEGGKLNFTVINEELN